MSTAFGNVKKTEKIWTRGGGMRGIVRQGRERRDSRGTDSTVRASEIAGGSEGR